MVDFRSQPIAVIGMACKLSGGVDSPQKFWEMLKEGRNGFSKSPNERFHTEAFCHPQNDMQGTFNLQGGHFINEDLSRFDAPFFNISAAKAKAMDPQQRLALESAFEALESAGIPMSSVVGSRTSVYTSTYNRDYAFMSIRDPEAMPKYQFLGTGDALLSNRILYFFDLKGPSITIDTGSSGSLVTLHHACQSIKSGESTMAIVNASSLILDPAVMVSMSSLGFLSDEGRCFAFDSRGNGYGRGEAVAAVVLKPLDKALEDGDPIRAVIRNTFCNQDGRTPGITMPPKEAQIAMIRSAYLGAGLDMADTTYCESHGPGTPAGDPIEAGTIAATLGKHRHGGRPIIVGTAKTNLGHTEACASLAGLIKVVLMLENATIVPNYDFQLPNPNIALDEMNIHIPTKLIPWPGTGIRRASINAFGYGGTNAHAIIDDAESFLQQHGMFRPGVQVPAAIRKFDYTHENKPLQPLLFPISARTEKALLARIASVKDYLIASKDQQQSQLLSDLSYTLTSKRSHLPRKAFVVASSIEELQSNLQSPVSLPQASESGDHRLVAFCFTGQAAQWAGMGFELLDTHSVFAESLQKCDEVLSGFGAPWSLIEELKKSPDTSRLSEAQLSQPACTAIQIALVDLLASWHIFPQAVFGHSSGEIAAAYSCGVLSMVDAMTVSYERGFWCGMIKEVAPNDKGAMMAVGLSEDGITPYLSTIEGGQAVIACVNSSSSITVSGDRVAIEKLKISLDQDGVFARELHVDTAYHSHQMESIAHFYGDSLSDLQIKKPASNIKFFSSVTGKLWDESDGLTFDATYWVSNMVSQVKFLHSVEAFGQYIEPRNELDTKTIIEIGPHPVLAGPIKEILRSPFMSALNVNYLPSLIRKQNAAVSTSNLAGQLYLRGYPIHFPSIPIKGAIAYSPRVLVDLPKYPWDRSTQYWAESRLSSDYRLRTRPRHHLLGAPAMDWNPLEPSWRTFLRPSELPWVNGHKVHGDILYPAGGFIATVLQACYEYHLLKRSKQQPHRYILRDFEILKALVIPEGSDGIEMKTTLRAHTRPGWLKFTIHSCTLEKVWSELCVGQATIEYSSPQIFFSCSDNRVLQEQFSKAFNQVETKKADWDNMEPFTFYKRLEALGYQFSAPFTNVNHIQSSGSQVITAITTPNTAEHMPKEYEVEQILHPATIDSFIQTPFAALLHTEGTPTFVPTRIDLISVFAEIKHVAGLKMKALATLKTHGTRTFSADIKVKSCDVDNRPMVMVEGLTYTALDGVPLLREVQKTLDICYKIVHRPDTSYLTTEGLRRMSADDLSLVVNADQRTQLFDVACKLLINDALEKLGKWEPDSTTPLHICRLFDWMQARKLNEQQLAESRSLISSLSDHGRSRSDSPHGEELEDQLRQKVESFGAVGKMIYRVGPWLADIVLGHQDTLTLMLREDLLNDYYKEDSVTRCYPVMRRYLECLRHKHPDMKILEIGAGTGGATRHVLQSLDGKYKQYDFTDISAGFFVKAEKEFKTTGSRISFKKLNVENDPVDQGFEEQSYDLIVAANVLHATKSMETTLRNTRRLLKPGGTLVLLEITDLKLYTGMIFGTLPGWWLGEEKFRPDGPTLDIHEWEIELQQANFSGVDLHIPDHDDPALLQTELIVSRAADSTPADSIPLQVDFFLNPKVNFDHVYELQRFIDMNMDVKSPTTSGSPSSVIIVLDDGPNTILDNLDAQGFEKVKDMISSHTGLLWVTRGGASEASHPQFGTVSGFARTVRVENSNFPFLTLDLDPNENDYFARRFETVWKMVQYLHFLLHAGNHEFGDVEFVQRDGFLQIPRLVKDERSSRLLTTGALAERPDLRNFWHIDRPLILSLLDPMDLKSLHWIDRHSPIPKPGPDDIVVKVKAFGLNGVSSQKPANRTGDIEMNGGCSGVVVAVGKDVEHQFTIDDAVFGWSGSPFSSYIVLKTNTARQILHDLSFEDVAALSIAATSAVYALNDVIRLQKGESILIHNAADPIGHVAIQIAQNIGAHIFATVSSAEQKGLLIQEFGIASEAVFANLAVQFGAGIKHILPGGVDAVVSSVNGEALDASVACLAPFGRIVHFGSRDFQRDDSMQLRSLGHNASFYSIDMAAVLQYKPTVFGKLLDESLDLVSQGIVRMDAQKYSLDELGHVFSRALNGELNGNPVFLVDSEVSVPVIDEILPVHLPNTATYVLAGGLGGLGRVITEWLYSTCRAEHVAILTRSLPPAGSMRDKWIQEMRTKGLNLQVYACDISDKTSLQSTLSLIAQTQPPIRGLIQCAMILKDSILENMPLDSWTAVLDPKINGSLNLHNSLPDQDHLDFFIMLSSTAGVIGNAGQANYAAGCSFQDALARHRVSKGLKGMSLDLGMIEEAGYIAERPQDVMGFEKRGHLAVNLEWMFRLITKAMVIPATTVDEAQIVLQYDRSTGCDGEFPENMMANPMFSHLRASYSNASPLSDTTSTFADKTDTKESLRSADSFPEATQIILLALIERLSKLLAVPTDDMTSTSRINDMGADSLVAVELRNWVSKELEADVKVLEILAGETLGRFAEGIAKRCRLLKTAA